MLYHVLHQNRTKPISLKVLTLMSNDPFIQIKEAQHWVQNGKIIVYPTDTIWGIGCDPCNQEAVDRIFKIKNRPKDKPLLVLVSDIEMLRQYVVDVHPKLDKLLLYSDRPISVIYKLADSDCPFAMGVVSNDKSVCIRVVKTGITHHLINEIGHPIVGTSANIHGEDSPSSFLSISPKVIKAVDYVFEVQDDSYMTGKASTIIRLDQNEKEFEFIR